MTVVIGSQNTNFPYEGNDQNIRIFAVDRRGRIWYELTEAVMQSAVQRWGEPDSASISVSPLAVPNNYLPLKTLDFEIRIHIPDQDKPIWGEPVSKKGGVGGVTIEVDGLLSMIGDRFISRSSEIFTSMPQGLIMKRLIELAQEESRQKFRNLNLTPRILDLGTVALKRRSRQYLREQHTNILDNLYEFRNTSTPIVLDMTYRPVNPFRPFGEWVRYVDIIPVYDIIYPLATKLFYSHRDGSNNILSFSFSEDANDLANNVYTTGGTSGNIRFEGHVVDQFSASVHGDRQAVVSKGGLTDPDWLKSEAQGEVNTRKRPVQSVTLQTVTVPSPVARYAWKGTIWPVRIDYGMIQVDGNFRIMSRTYNSNRTVTLEVERMTKPIPQPKKALLRWPGGL